MPAVQSKEKSKRAMLVSARRAKRMRNSVIAGVLAVGVAAASFSGSNVPSIWASGGDGDFLMPGQQLMQDRLTPEDAESNTSLTAEELRALSEQRLREKFAAQENGLWTEACGGNDKGEDYQECIRQALSYGGSEHANQTPDIDPDLIESASAVPVSLDNGKVADGLRTLGGGDPSGGGTSGLGVPVGAIGIGLVGNVLPLTLSQPGVGVIAEDPTENPEAPEPPTDPEMPDGEVPIPAPLLLFPAGVAILRFLKR